jgi:hypothetical protein
MAGNDRVDHAANPAMLLQLPLRIVAVRDQWLRIDESRLQHNVQLLERDHAEIERDAEQVTRRLPDAKARLETAAGAYEVWLMKT